MGAGESKPVQVQAVTKETILEAVQIDGLALERNATWNDENDIVLAAVSQNGLALRFASGRLKDNYDIVLAAVSRDCLALQFASGRLEDNETTWIAQGKGRHQSRDEPLSLT